MANLKKLVIIAVVISILLSNTEAASDKTSIKVKSLMLKGEKVPIIVILKDQPSFNTLSPENVVPLLKRYATNSQHNIAVLLNEEKKRDKADKIKQFWIVNAIAVNASPGLIEQLSARDDVESIELDSQVHMVEDNSVQFSQGQIDDATAEIKRINAAKAWEIGIDGTGINVSVIDTGIYADHSDISGRVIKWVDYVNGQSLPYDDHGHGTHVAGTVGGNGAGGMTTGVAPNVSLFGAKVLDSTGSGDSSNVIKAIEWSVENKADIVSLSLGGGRDIAMKNAVNNAISAGVTVIAAAGNSGPGAGTIIFPAGEKNVIAVGAVDSADTIAWFSSRGPITVDGKELMKPDISAPGVCINSLAKSGGYAYCWQGTSMATPHVSGTVALLLQAARNNGLFLSPAQVRSILENTSVDLVSRHSSKVG
ncbi:MAG TPA: S8 family serine peptidase [Candidatus Limnocylindrales bacterium]|nr:S8 family serine peptidase [Candidatus Limnocylindrales bacterium]